MDASTNDQGEPSRARGDGAPDPAHEQSIWNFFGALYRQRRWIVGITLIAAVGSVVGSLMLPDWYRSSTRLLPPESSMGSNFSAMLSSTSGGLGSVAQSVLGGSSGNYMRYMSILSSESMMRAVVNEFDLAEVYQTTDSKAPVVRAMQKLEENVDFVIDDQYEFLSIKVYDQKPDRAAEMANFLADRLNERHTQLSSQHAGNYRKFVEKRYRQAQTELDSILRIKQQFEEQHGVVQLPEQAQQFLSSMAEIRAQTVQHEIRYRALRSQYGSQNDQVASARELVEAANEKWQGMMEGEDGLLPVAYSNLPELGRRYAQIMQEVTVQEEILRFLGPMYEQARFNEQREMTAVQVIDPATPPIEPAWPIRSLVCIAATLSAFLLAVFGALLYDWIWRNREYLARHIERDVVSANGNQKLQSPASSSRS